MSGAASRTRVRRRMRNVRKIPRNRRRPNYTLLFCVFLISAAVSCGGSFVLQAQALVVSEVSIHGVSLADRAVVEREAKAVLGKNILLMPKSRIISDLRRLHEVEEVKMGRSLPNKVWVRLWERKPDAVVTNTRDYCMVEDGGLAFHKTQGPVEGLPLLEVPACDAIKEGGVCNSDGVQHALQVLKCARGARLEVTKISVDPLGDICLNMRSGFYVRLGQPDDITWKISRLRDALVHKPSIRDEAAYVDISCPTAVVWKPKLVTGAAL